MDAELQSLQFEYNELCQRIKPSNGKYTILTEREDVGVAHIEFSDGQYHYIVTERGLDLETRSTGDRSDILYWMVYDLTFWMGVAYEFENRVDGPDVRRKIFAHQIEMMKRADHHFARRLEIEIAETLIRNPFVDHA